MNDFTKEELKRLRTSNNLAMSSYGHTPERLALLNKLNSLIDNYCEHTDTECIGGWVSKCTRCGMKFGDETQ